MDVTGVASSSTSTNAVSDNADGTQQDPTRHAWTITPTPSGPTASSSKDDQNTSSTKDSEAENTTKKRKLSHEQESMEESAELGSIVTSLRSGTGNSRLCAILRSLDQILREPEELGKEISDLEEEKSNLESKLAELRASTSITERKLKSKKKKFYTTNDDADWGDVTVVTMRAEETERRITELQEQKLKIESTLKAQK